MNLFKSSYPLSGNTTCQWLQLLNKIDFDKRHPLETFLEFRRSTISEDRISDSDTPLDINVIGVLKPRSFANLDVGWLSGKRIRFAEKHVRVEKREIELQQQNSERSLEQRPAVCFKSDRVWCPGS